MSLNTTPNSDRVHIGLFGRTNAGKSQLINAITNQNLAVVSNVAGTTTDPVYKSMEILPLGPVVLIDTAGLDDYGELGQLRIKKTKQVLNKTDIALLIVDATVGLKKEDEDILKLIKEKNIPYLVVFNKIDLIKEAPKLENSICVSALTKLNVNELREKIASLVSNEDNDKKLISDLLEPNDLIVLVVPIDKAAPKGRLILPQQQVIRDALEAGANVVVVRDLELQHFIETEQRKIKMVVTDSQVFDYVSKIVPKEISLTSFSILMSRYKGNLDQQAKGALFVDKLKDGDTVLISEGCTHHRQCNDIGSVKLPNWIKKRTGKELNFEFTSGVEFPEDLSKYAMIVHCGGCMLNEREIQYRLKCAYDANVPMTNYGTLIAHIHGILERCLFLLAK
ncbi:MAG: [FeFe] hydrogenase H-cluster maturation GTPase HydF [Alphaproteobacteria bacterium]|nr:[FeFe] hydrogenase H-cluster maturation GTPase HydF [Alphaproteobacteria bacterium]